MRAFLRIFMSIVMIALVSGNAMAKKNPTMPTRKVGYRFKGDSLYVSSGYQDVLSTAVRQKLKSGLPTRIVLEVAVRDANGHPVAVFARTVKIVYDLWDEIFTITMSQPGVKKKTTVNTIDDVVRIAGALRYVRIANGLKESKYRIHCRVRANPISKKMVRNIQKWITASGGQFGQGGNASYFGSFVGHLVDRDIGKADRSVDYQSQWLEK